MAGIYRHPWHHNTRRKPWIGTKPVGGGIRTAADVLATTDRATRYLRNQYYIQAIAANPLAYFRFNEKTGTVAYNDARMATSFANEALADNPGLLWLFDETSGSSATDSSGNGHTGTYTAFTLNQAPLIPGDTGKSILNSTSGFGNRSVTSAYNPFSGIVSFEFVAANGTGGNESRLMRSDGADNVYIGTSSASTTLVFSVRANTYGVSWGGALPFDGVAYHYVLTYDPVSGLAELWRNGLSWGAQGLGVGAGWGADPGNVLFGDVAYAGWVGSADAFAVYPGGLSRTRIAQHAAWMLSGTYNSATLGQSSLVGDPSDSSFSLANTGSVNTNVQPFPQMSTLEKRTFVAVVNRAANTDDDTIFGSNVGGSGSSSLYVNTSGNVLWEPGTGFPQTWTAAWPGQNQNVHVALRASTNDYELFINGVSQGARSTPYQWGGGNPAGLVRVGAQGAFGGMEWNGSIDEFAVYDGHLSDKQIADMNAARGTTTARIRTAADTLGTTDLSVGGKIIPRTGADALGTTDAATRAALSRVRTGADALGTTDAATRAALSRVRTSADTLTTTDAAVKTFAPVRTAADTLGTADAATRSFTRARIGTDALGTVDTATQLRVLLRAAADALGTTDVATQVRVLSRTAADNLGTTDAATRAAISRLRTAADSLGTTESAVGFAGTRSGSDTLGTTDAATRAAISRVRTATDSLVTTDAAVRTSARARTTTDTLGTTDAATRALIAFLRAAVDSLGTSDGALKGGVTIKTAADAFSTTDAATRDVLSRVRTTADALSTTDAATRAALSRVRTAADALATTDAATKTSTLQLKTAVDSLATTDAAVRAVLFARLASDSLSTTDSAARNVFRHLTAADSLSTTDVASRLRISARFTADTLGTTDEAVGLTGVLGAPLLYGPLHVLVVFSTSEATVDDYESETTVTIYSSKAKLDTPDYVAKVTYR